MSEKKKQVEKKIFEQTRISHFPRPVVVVTSINDKKEIGATTISWTGVVSSQPPILSVSFLPDSFTRNCILESREFTINIPTDKNLIETNFLGSISGPWDFKREELMKRYSKELTLVKGLSIRSPYIEEFYMHIECRVFNVIQVGLYDCFLGLVKTMFCSKYLYQNTHPKGDLSYGEISPIFCLADQYWNTGRNLGISNENKNHPHGDTH